MRSRSFPSRFFTLALILLAAMGSQASGELVRNGDFGSAFSNWNINPDGDIDRTISPENSPFTEVNAENGASAMLEDLGGVGFHTALSQSVLHATGIVEVSFDFRMLPGGDGAWRLALMAEQEPVVSVRMCPSTGFAVQGPDSTETEVQLRRDVWYHARIQINLDERTCAGSLVEDEYGELVTWEALKLEFPEEVAGIGITQIFVQEASAAETLSAPLQIDNISLQYTK